MHRISHTNPKYIKRNRFFSFSFYIHRISHTNPIFHLTYIHRTSLARTLLYTHMLLTPLSLSIYLSISLSLSLSVSFSFCLCLSLSVSVSLPLSLCLLSHSLSLFSRILPSRAHTPSRTLARSPPPPPSLLHSPPLTLRRIPATSSPCPERSHSLLLCQGP